MKVSLTFFLSLLLPLAAQNDLQKDHSFPTTVTETGIPGLIADGSSSPSAPKPEPIHYEVLSSMTKRKFVSESSEIADLPPVEGVINATIQLVADPGLVDPPPPLPKLPRDDAAVQSRMVQTRQKFPEFRMLFVSAGVIDHRKTVLRCYPDGQGKGEVSVVSNIDFHDFSGFATFNVKGVNRETGAEETRRYALIMSISDLNSAARNPPQAVTEKQGRAVVLPELPTGPEPAFVVTDGNDPDALQAIADMHSLYQVEGAKMRQARLSREKAHEERRAYLVAHPPKPQDVTFKFWNRSEPLPASGLENGGGQ